MFTPKKVSALDPEIRRFCTEVLDSVGTDGFDFATDIGDVVPMRVIGMLLGIPTDQQEAIRDGLTGYDKITTSTANAGSSIPNSCSIT